MIKIEDMTVSKELDVSEMSTARGGGDHFAPPCAASTLDPVGQAACDCQETWYEVFGPLMG